MKVASLALLLVIGLAGPAAAESVSRTLGAPEDRVWAATEALLKHQGWEIEKSDRTIGWIVLWMDKDEPVPVKDQSVEKTLIDDIGKSL